MTGAMVAAGLLLAVVAFALAFSALRMAILSACGAGAVCLVTVALVPTQLFQWAFAGCWLSLIGTSLLVYFPVAQRRFVWVSPVVAINGGLWAGTVIATEATSYDSLIVISVLILFLPARFLISMGWALVVKIITSWLLAVALLVGSIPLLVVHPGYLPDHRE